MKKLRSNVSLDRHRSNITTTTTTTTKYYKSQDNISIGIRLNSFFIIIIILLLLCNKIDKADCFHNFYYTSTTTSIHRKIHSKGITHPLWKEQDKVIVLKRKMAKYNHNSKQSQMNSEKLPSMIVFDLDDCLWTPEMHELYDAPTIPIQGNLNPSSSEEEEKGVVGMGVPRIGQIVRLYDGARQSLRELALNPKYKNIILAVASTSLEPSYSHLCLEGIEVIPGLTIKDMLT